MVEPDANGLERTWVPGNVLAIGRVRMAFTDRYEGVSLPPADLRRLGTEWVRTARRRLAARFGLSPDQVVYMKQVHGANVAFVTRPFTTDPPSLDGMCTTEDSLALAVLMADCAAVLLADPAAGVVGVAHAGRLGTAGSVVSRLLGTMRTHGADPARTVALIGPTICELCYEVPAEMRDEIAALVPGTWARTRRGTPSIDLRAGICSQLQAAGVTDIRHDRRCTAESPELFSHRREGATGDFAGYIWLTPPIQEHIDE